MNPQFSSDKILWGEEAPSTGFRLRGAGGRRELSEKETVVSNYLLWRVVGIYKEAKKCTFWGLQRYFSQNFKKFNSKPFDFLLIFGLTIRLDFKNICTNCSYFKKLIS